MFHHCCATIILTYFNCPIYANLYTKNKGIYHSCSKIFGDLINFFVVAGDETYVISPGNNNLKIIASRNKDKYKEKKN